MSQTSKTPSERAMTTRGTRADTAATAILEKFGQVHPHWVKPCSEIIDNAFPAYDALREALEYFMHYYASNSHNRKLCFGQRAKALCPHCKAEAALAEAEGKP